MDSTDVDAINLALLALRCGVGAVMLAHGINHIFGGGKIAGTARWFGGLGMKPGILHAWVASITEVVGGALLVIGLLTPFAGAAVIGVMLVAIVTNHRGNGFFIFRPGEGWEYVMTLTIVGFAIATLGAGEWSVDHAAEIFDPPGVDGLLIALIAGVGGAAGLLAAFWRPEPKPD
ncbi:MAG: DoxX family protein [Acidimicrobiales bacterium]